MRPVLAAVLCLVIPSLSLAAPADSTAAGRANSLKAGVWALQFAVNGNLSGGGVFLKRQLQPNHAIRFGVEINSFASSEDGSLDTTQTIIGTAQYDDDYVSTHVELVAVRYSNPAASAHFYYGVGPFVDFSDSHAERMETLGQEMLTRITDWNSYSIGGTFLIGAEWFASAAMSLHMEYTITAGYSSDEFEYTSLYESPSTNDPVLRERSERSRWFFDAGNQVRLGLGIYF